LFSRFSGVAELSANPEHLRYRGVSRQAGGAGAPEHPSGGGDAVLELRRFALCNIEGSRSTPSKTIRWRSRNHSPGAFVEEPTVRKVLDAYLTETHPSPILQKREIIAYWMRVSLETEEEGYRNRVRFIVFMCICINVYAQSLITVSAKRSRLISKILV